MCNLKQDDFWKEVKVMNNSYTPLPGSVEGVTGDNNEFEMWKSHFHEIFNCIRSESTFLSNYDFSGESVNDVFVSPIDTENAVNS